MDIKEIESALRKARRDVFSDDEAIAEQASRDIARLKQLAKPFWDAREKPESAYARVMWM